jgi:hypothetical protein
MDLKRPDGSALLDRIGGLELMSPPPPDYAMAVLFKHLTKDDVPLGTEVWSTD